MRTTISSTIFAILIGAFQLFVINKTEAKNINSLSGFSISSSQSDNYVLAPDRFEQDIALFMGLIRTDFNNAQMVYMHPNAELKFEYIIDKYGKVPLNLFLEGIMPAIKYQSTTSALVLFYNPWVDLVFITEWQVFEEDIFVTDMELVSADFLSYDGSPLAMVDPLWKRLHEETIIENLYEQMNDRNKLFDELWDIQLGPGNWRETLTCLKNTEYIIREQSVVALRLRNHYINIRDLWNSNYMEDLRYSMIEYLINLEEGIDGMFEILMDGPETPDETMDVVANIAPELWESSSVQNTVKVESGAFVFVVSPKLPKYFLSFYFEFVGKTKLQFKRLDWCSFDSEPLN